MTVTMNDMQSQLKTLASSQTNQARSKIKFYCRSCGRNFIHGSKNCSEKKAGYQEEAYYKKSMGGSEKKYDWRLGAIDNKIEISNPKISLINHIDNPPNPTNNNMIAIADSGANIHLERQATPTMEPELQIPGLRKLGRQIHIYRKCRQTH